MTHEQVVRAYRSGEVSAKVHRRRALWAMRGSRPAMCHRVGHPLFWWLWLIFLPVPGLLAIWVSFQIGMILLALGCMLPGTITRLAVRSVLKQALEDQEFYKLAVQSGVLEIRARGR